MQIRQMDFVREMVRLCEDAWTLGWHERNAGNLSYRLTWEESRCVLDAIESHGCEGDDWTDTGLVLPQLAGSLICVSGAGACFRNAGHCPELVFGIVQISSEGSSYRVLWGLEGGRPTSEFPTHLLAHAARMDAERESCAEGCQSRVVYHAHCPNAITLSNILPPDSRVWTRALWQAMTEAVLFFPEGVGVLPWMVPGGCDIARASARVLGDFRSCIWTQHGLFATGCSFDDAFGLAHMIEKTAGIYLAGRAACGGAEPPYGVSDAQLRLICEESGVLPREGFLD